MSDNCPYCNHEVRINHDDGDGLEDGETFEKECGVCGKTFVYTTIISITHVLDKADCLNDIATHDFKMSCTIPKDFTYMRCKVCGNRRKLTTEERASIGLGPDLWSTIGTGAKPKEGAQ